MSTTYQEIVYAADAVVRGLLMQASIDCPPVDPFRVAAAQGLDAQYSSSIDSRSAHTQSPLGGGVLLIRPEESTVAAGERECFACAHELAESSVAARILTKAGVDDPSDELREWTCNLFAGALLAPADWFRQAWQEQAGDLRRVKRVFGTASHEVLARRLITWEVPTVVTVVDNGRVTSRTGNCQHIDKLTPTERQAVEKLSGRQRTIDLTAEPLRVEGWRIDADGWERIILRLTVET